MNTLTLPTYLTAGPATGKSAVVAEPLALFYPAPQDDRPAITSPDAAFEVLGPHLQGADREVCLLALLDTRHYLLGVKVVSVGSVDHTFMAPREVFRDALTGNASCVVVAHNHPSGNPSPSHDDEAVTRRLGLAGEMLNVELLDSLVIAGDQWTSLARQGVI